MTAWSARSGGLKVEEEHRLLGGVLLWLGQLPAVDARFLQGLLATPPQPTPPPSRWPRPVRASTWVSSGARSASPPRPAFTLTVTIALQAVPEPDTAEKVEEVVLQPVLFPGGRWPERQP